MNETGYYNLSRVVLNWFNSNKYYITACCSSSYGINPHYLPPCKTDPQNLLLQLIIILEMSGIKAISLYRVSKPAWCMYIVLCMGLYMKAKGLLSNVNNHWNEHSLWGVYSLHKDYLSIIKFKKEIMNVNIAYYTTLNISITSQGIGSIYRYIL